MIFITTELYVMSIIFRTCRRRYSLVKTIYTVTMEEENFSCVVAFPNFNTGRRQETWRNCDTVETTLLCSYKFTSCKWRVVVLGRQLALW